MMVVEQVASMYNIKFDKCDHQKIKMYVCNRIQAKNQCEGVISILGDEETMRVKSFPRSTNLPNANNREGKTSADVALKQRRVPVGQA
jgi:hypothetical protein